MKKYLKILCLLIVFFPLKGQNMNKDFYALIDKAVTKLYQNPEECITFSQSVIINTKSAEQKINLQNIMAQAYAAKGDYVQSIKTSLEGESFADAKEYKGFLQMYMDYNLAEQYQNLGLYRQSESIINEAIANSSSLKTSQPDMKVALAKFYQLKASNLSITQNRDAARNALEKSNSFLHNAGNENLIIRSENTLHLAWMLTNDNKLAEAKLLIEKVLKDISGKKFQFLEAVAYEKLARISFLQNKNEESVSYLDQALSLVQDSGYLPLYVTIYDGYSKNYSVMHQAAAYQKFNKLYLEAKTKIDSNKKDGIRYLLKLVENQENKSLQYYESSKKKNAIIFFLIAVALVIVVSLYYLSVLKSNKELKKQVEFFDNLKEVAKTKSITEKEPLVETMINSQEVEEKSDRKLNVISKEKENEILEKLDELEKSERYLDNHMSLATLAAQLDTNTKYLSEVINNSKGKNFNGYINELRINHIAYLLKNNPEFLNYKISYLAEFAGFSSHSAFTTVFKSVTGMSPNTYIQQIHQSQKL